MHPNPGLLASLPTVICIGPLRTAGLGGLERGIRLRDFVRVLSSINIHVKTHEVKSLKGEYISHASLGPAEVTNKP